MTLPDPFRCQGAMRTQADRVVVLTKAAGTPTARHRSFLIVLAPTSEKP